MTGTAARIDGNLLTSLRAKSTIRGWTLLHYFFTQVVMFQLCHNHLIIMHDVLNINMQYLKRHEYYIFLTNLPLNKIAMNKSYFINILLTKQVCALHSLE